MVALIFLLEHLRPKVAIEIGTEDGGSLQVLSHFCDRVFAIDRDQDVPRRLEGKFSNVEYLIGPSQKILPPLIDRLQREKFRALESRTSWRTKPDLNLAGFDVGKDLSPEPREQEVDQHSSDRHISAYGEPPQPQHCLEPLLVPGP